MLCLGSIGINRVISEPCYKGKILQRIDWSFSYNSVVKFHGKKIGEPWSHNMTVLYRDKCFNKVFF